MIWKTSYFGRNTAETVALWVIKSTITETFACFLSYHLFSIALLPCPPPSVIVNPCPATFTCFDSKQTENSCVRDCPEHTMPNSSMNSHQPLLSNFCFSLFSVQCVLPALVKGGAVQLKQRKKGL